jgi:5'-nucleotidase
MSKAILLIDMDGTACDWTSKLRENFEAKYPDRKMLPEQELIKFYVEDLHPEEWRADMRAVVQEQGFYSSLVPITGAIEALKDIENNCLGFVEPFICSSPEVEYESQLCHTEKAAWVEKHLGRFWTKRLILTKDKTLVRGHILIDDKPEITGALSPTWTQLVYAQPWNANLEGGAMPRFTWEDWPAFRDNILAANFGGKKALAHTGSSIIIVP